MTLVRDLAGKYASDHEWLKWKRDQIRAELGVKCSDDMVDTIVSWCCDEIPGPYYTTWTF